ncbi:DedA family protein [Fimbriimonas ginsengisoli]|uniref:DedA protein n=1 Tax=Fimbriimonas ginsengisoli Gsoil 348 TaxID=661478 RepID=A0A068NQ73_FIMGI|nr:DedA family protein [Fimbriimonas ginsengisoli]AIE84910.1 DedA protein [Fimbriimonas ginsengisoli Gsoil 348]
MIDFLIHLDKNVRDLVPHYGAGAYGILFAIIFAETGLIVVPFLPGDSLLFMLGIFSVSSVVKGQVEPPAFNVWIIFPLLAAAAILGDQLNYQIGRYFGSHLFKNEKSKLFKPSHLRTTHEFYEKHGSKTVLLARFVPIVRALAPFVAGMSSMPYRTFTAWSVGGAVLWVGVCVFAGHLFGNIPIVRDHFEIGILVILAFSVIPVIFEVVRHRKKKANGNQSRS